MTVNTTQVENRTRRSRIRPNIGKLKVNLTSLSFLAKAVYLGALLSIVWQNIQISGLLLALSIVDALLYKTAQKQGKVDSLKLFVFFSAVFGVLATLDTNLFWGYLYGVWVTWSAFQQLVTANKTEETVQVSYVLRSTLLLATLALIYVLVPNYAWILRMSLVGAIWVGDPKPGLPKREDTRGELKAKHLIRIGVWVSISLGLITSGQYWDFWQGVSLLSWVGLGAIGYGLQKPNPPPEETATARRTKTARMARRRGS